MPVSMFQERCHRTACSFAGSARSAVRSWFWSCWWFVVKSARRMSEGGRSHARTAWPGLVLGRQAAGVGMEPAMTLPGWAFGGPIHCAHRQTGPLASSRFPTVSNGWRCFSTTTTTALKMQTKTGPLQHDQRGKLVRFGQLCSILWTNDQPVRPAYFDWGSLIALVLGIPSSEPVSIIHLYLSPTNLQRIPPSRPPQLDRSVLETPFMRHLSPKIAEQTDHDANSRGARSHNHQSVAA